MPLNPKSKTRNLKSILVSCLILLLLAACASSNPIDTGGPTNFKHHTGVFTLQVPGSWKQAQAAVETESLARFSDPNGRAELIAYAGLLDHRLSNEDGKQAVTTLTTSLLNAPGDLKMTEPRRQPDGSFSAALSFTRGNEKRSGQAIFRDDQLALSGVILSGPEAGWADFQKAMQPYLDSFKIDGDYVQGTFFAPLEGDAYALVVPGGWPQQGGANVKTIRSPSGNMTILVAQKAASAALTQAALAEEGSRLVQQYLGPGKLVSNETLSDGRLKIAIERGDRRTIGYVDQKEGNLVGLFFDVPAARAGDYQPFIDFVYSTLITGKA